MSKYRDCTTGRQADRCASHFMDIIMQYLQLTVVLITGEQNVLLSPYSTMDNAFLLMFSNSASAEGCIIRPKQVLIKIPTTSFPLRQNKLMSPDDATPSTIIR